MAMESTLDPETLRQQVTSPGGTTEMALSVMQKEMLEAKINAAIRAACERSRELAHLLGDEN